LRSFGIVALVVGLGTSCTSPSERGEIAPRNAGINVLLITVDTLRYDHLSINGYARPTSPNIDALAAKGVVFDAAFTYWPKTRTSFASIFTGLYASQHGLTVRDRDLPRFNQTLAETFQSAGYRTRAAVDNANLDAELGFDQGFDQYEQTWQMEGTTELDRTESITEFGVGTLSSEGDGRPLFLWLHYVNPHTPYDPPKDDLDLFRGDGVVPPGPELQTVVGFHGGVNRHLAIEGETHWGDYIDRYDAEIHVADRHIGRVLEALDNGPYAGKTLVVFTSDHGESLGEHDYFFDHGYDLFNPSLRIPLILSFPGFLPAGERVSGQVSTLDLFPTILDLSQVSYPHDDFQGRSVLALVRGSTERLHKRLFFQNDQHQMAIINGHLKLIYYPESESGAEGCELYDMYRDPREADDRFAESEARIGPIEAELSSFFTQTVAWHQGTTARREQVPVTEDSQLSEAARRSLESLGYLGREKGRIAPHSLNCRPR
jgi:arylsulfatase